MYHTYLGIDMMYHLRLVLSFLIKISGTQKCKVLIGTHGPHWSSEVLQPLLSMYAKM